MAPIDAVSVRAYMVPTETPESDGTLEWNSTTMVYVEIRSGGTTGIGYTYGSTAVARLIEDSLAAVLLHTAELTEHMSGWVQSGVPRVKMKIGRQPDRDEDRVAAVRRAIGDEAQLFVDANGAYSVKQALAMARAVEPHGVSWFEEPVYHRDLAGNAAVRARHVEYFFDHVRIERLFFDGARDPKDGSLVPDLQRHGIGLELKRQDAERYAL